MVGNEWASVVKAIRIITEQIYAIQRDKITKTLATSTIRSPCNFTSTGISSTSVHSITGLSLTEAVTRTVSQLQRAQSKQDNIEQEKLVTPEEQAELNQKFQSIFDVTQFDKFIDDNRRNREKIQAMQKENERNRPFDKYAEEAVENFQQLQKQSAVQTENENKAPTTETKKEERVMAAVSKPKVKQKLSDQSRQRAVPSSRLGRMFAFGTLAVELGINTAAEYATKKLGSGPAVVQEGIGGTFLSPANAEKIVDTLCKVRGAALKLGQLLSLQDETTMSPELMKIFERVRQSADFMPLSQVEKVMKAELGFDWRSKFGSFEEKPFAAASIGQVHLASLKDGTEVAVKIQYPGVAKGINSDIDNLVSVLNVWNIFPKGLFIENIVEVAKKELAWEVDYIREAECTKKFKELLAPYKDYYVPTVYSEFSTGHVLTTELIEGVPLDKCFDMDLKTREDIAYKIMNLILHEMFVFRCMQTDPNWSNFFYDQATGRIILLDFGATRMYSKEFMDKYIEIIKAASEGDGVKVLNMSREMKFLTGYESKVMEQAHVDTVMIMAEIFTPKEGRKFNFGGQNTTKRLQSLVPTILTHRLCPPPEEIYSLHRKLSGVFLLCAKLKVQMDCKDMFQSVYNQYHLQ